MYVQLTKKSIASNLLIPLTIVDFAKIYLHSLSSFFPSVSKRLISFKILSTLVNVFVMLALFKTGSVLTESGLSVDVKLMLDLAAATALPRCVLNWLKFGTEGDGH